MKLRYGNMFDHMDECDVLLVTTNSYIKKDGSLVMGKGAAKQLLNMSPNIAKCFGQDIKHLSTYGLVLGPNEYYEKVFGGFQTKIHFKDPSKLETIEYSTEKLVDEANAFSNETFFLNYPGIGNGGLTREEVEPIISVLPDNVHVWI